jgi:hypothetical protein
LAAKELAAKESEEEAAKELAAKKSEEVAEAEIGQVETKLHVRWPSCMERQSEKATAGDSSARWSSVSWPALPEYERDFGAELMANSSAEQAAEQGAEQAARVKAVEAEERKAEFGQEETKLPARWPFCVESQGSAPAVGTTSSASGCYTSSGSDDN